MQDHKRDREMEKLFWSDPWFPPRRSHYHRAAPHTSSPSPSPSPKSKVISIPVIDGSKTPITISNKLDRPSATVNIQKAVRGFLVRKAMQTLRKVAAEAEEIGHQISPDKVLSNAKERLRIGEMLMALLLRLDAVRGVRDYRKKVIRRVIQLQEALDSITQPASALTDTAITTETTEQEEKEAIQQEDGMMEDVMNVADDTPIASEEFEEEAQQIEDLMIEEAVKDNEGTVGKEMEQECDGMPETTDNMTEEVPRKAELSSADEKTGMKEMMEKSAVENETLKRLVGELCERSAQQCELMRGLVQRVERLERRFQGMGRRKKRDQAKHSNKHYAT